MVCGNAKKTDTEPAEAERPLKDAVREARIEAAERSGVVVDLRDADVARLELLNEALDPLFKEIPDDVELFDRGVSKGDMPRLWIDVVAHVEMGRDKRQYRFVQDTRYGRAVLAESYEVPAMVQAVTRYVARRLVERERALSDDAGSGVAQSVLRRDAAPSSLACRPHLHLTDLSLAWLRCSRLPCSAARTLADQHEALLLHDLARGREAAGYQLAVPGAA